MKNAKMAASEQDGRLLVGRRKSVQETFLCVLVDSICVPNFVRLRQSGRRGGHFKPRPLPFGHAHFRKFQIPKIFTEPDVCAKICEFSWSFRPSKMHSFRQKERRKKEELKPRAVVSGPSHPLAVRPPLRSASCCGRLPVGRRKSGQETFLCVFVDGICVPNFVRLRQSWRDGRLRSVAMATGKVKSKVFLIIINLTGV